MSAINYLDQLNVGGGTTLKKILRAAAALDFGSIASLTGLDLTIAVPGAALGDPVILGVPNGAVSAGLFFNAWVSATDVVTVRVLNLTVGAIDPASGTYSVVVLQF